MAAEPDDEAMDVLRRELRMPGPDRLLYVGDAFRHGLTRNEVARLSGIDPWFLAQIEDLIRCEARVRSEGMQVLQGETLRILKRKGFSDGRLAKLLGIRENIVRQARLKAGVRPVFKRVDTCAAEFSTTTAYMYSTYEEECEAQPTDRKKIIILGGGPNRIGQGIEFDYCCVHAAFAMKEIGYEAIMVNCNPETVSTDYDTSDRLYFEPLTFEDVMEIVDLEQPDGVIVQFGGQTPLKLARPSLAPARSRLISPRTGSCSSSSCSGWACASRLTARPVRRTRRCAWPLTSGFLSLSGPRSSWEVGRWKSCTRKMTSAST
jgi:carbamoyl-phosphate synthase large subunit